MTVLLTGGATARRLPDRARSLLKWQPDFDDLQAIVRHALAWERKLLARAG